MTPQQAKLFKFIDDYWRREGCCPSYEEMMPAMDYVSKSNIHRLIGGMEAQGYISRVPYRARTIQILKYPQGHPQAAKSVMKMKFTDADGKEIYTSKTIFLTNGAKIELVERAV